MRTKLRHRAITLVFACALSAFTGRPTRAAGDAAAAEALFIEGRRLMSEGHTLEACAKLAESHRLDPADGTLLNLGQCWEKAGRTASAWAVYREATALADAHGQRARAEYARTRVDALAPTLAHLRIELASKDCPPGLVIARDEVVVLEAAWGTDLPVDPGMHTVTASAPGHAPVSLEATVTPGKTATVVIPVLAPKAGDETAPAAAEGSPWRVGGTVAIIAGLAATLGGVMVGGLAKARNDDARRNECIVPVGCSERGAAMIDDARGLANASTVLVVAGVTLLASGITLVLVSRPRSPRVVSSAAYGIHF